MNACDNRSNTIENLIGYYRTIARIELLGAKVEHFELSKFVVMYFLDQQCFQNYEYGRVEYTEFHNTRNICSNAAPKLSL